MPITRAQSRALTRQRFQKKEVIPTPVEVIPTPVAPTRELYRGFYITGPRMKTRVDNFHDKTKSFSKINVLFDDYQDIPRPSMAIFEKEYNDERMWDSFFLFLRGGCRFSPELSKWCQILRSGFSSLSPINGINNLPIEQRAKALEESFIPFVLKFSRAVNLLYSDKTKFFETFDEKFCEIAQKGHRASFLLFAKFRPDMVTPECYPAINSRPTPQNLFETCKSVYLMDIYKPLLSQYESYF